MTSTNNLCEFFQKQSKYVWNRIAFARELNIRISETTITEELIFQFYRAFRDKSIAVRIFESIEEYKNGSDLEILVKTSRGFILLACQAKITYKTGKYWSFYHKVGGVLQIDLLRNYAKRNGGIAQYLLYNFVPFWSGSKESLEFKEKEDYGLTHISADELNNWMEEIKRAGKKPIVPGFNEFHPGKASPLYSLICALLKDNESFDKLFPATDLNKLIYYSEQDVTDADAWREITKLARIGYIEPEFVTNNYKESFGLEKSAPHQSVFSPKFRLVVGGEIQKGGLYRMS